jgi:hypothetical protein
MNLLNLIPRAVAFVTDSLEAIPWIKNQRKIFRANKERVAKALFALEVVIMFAVIYTLFNPMQTNFQELFFFWAIVFGILLDTYTRYVVDIR